MRRAYSSYSTMITTPGSRGGPRRTPIWCRGRFVDALDHRLVQLSLRRQCCANELIKADNPEMTDGQLAYSLEKLKEFGIIESAEALESGIGCQTDERYKQFFDTMVGIGVLEASPRLHPGRHPAIRVQRRRHGIGRPQD